MGRPRLTSVVPIPGSGVIDAVASSTQVHVSGLQGWEKDMKTEALIARNATDEVAIYLRFGEDGFADVSSDRVFSLEQRRRPALVETARNAANLIVAVREYDTVYVYETICLDEVLVYVWEIEVHGGNIVEHPPRKMFHN